MRIPLYADGTIPDLDSDPYTLRKIRSVKAPEHHEKSISVLGAKRNVGEHDALRLGHLVAESLQRLDNQDLARLTILKVLGASLVTPHEAMLAYETDYSKGKGLKRFNRSVRGSIEAANRTQPLIFAKLGEISIFGAPETSPGRRYIGAAITEEGSQELTEDRQAFLQSLIPEENSALLNHINNGHVHHVSLLSTTSEHSAQQAAESLSMEGIAGMWISLMHVTGNPKAFILDLPS